jgi:acetyl-CoA C-acetyltransferase
MAFAGGPLNNFVLQALVRMAQVLRAEPGSTGLVSAVSGMLTKQGVSLWASRAPEADFAWHDVSEAAARDTGAVELCDAAQADAKVASCTVLFESGHPVRTLFVCDLDDGRRTLATSADPALAEQAQREELIGRKLRLANGTAELC